MCWVLVERFLGTAEHSLHGCTGFLFSPQASLYRGINNSNLCWERFLFQLLSKVQYLNPPYLFAVFLSFCPRVREPVCPRTENFGHLNSIFWSLGQYSPLCSKSTVNRFRRCMAVYQHNVCHSRMMASREIPGQPWNPWMFLSIKPFTNAMKLMILKWGLWIIQMVSKCRSYLASLWEAVKGNLTVQKRNCDG